MLVPLAPRLLLLVLVSLQTHSTLFFVPALELVNAFIPENIRFSRKVLKCDSDNENDFLTSVTMGLRALNFSRLDSMDDLDLLSIAVSRVISNAWEVNARNIML